MPPCTIRSSKDHGQSIININLSHFKKSKNSMPQELPENKDKSDSVSRSLLISKQNKYYTRRNSTAMTTNRDIPSQLSYFIDN